MRVLYVKNGSNSANVSALLGRSQYDALYSDGKEGSEGLKMCLEKLKSGDTLYVERESLLSNTLGGAVKLLRDLANRGVNVWCERSGRLIESSTSPFRNLTEDIAQALLDFRNAFTRIRQDKGIMKAKLEGKRMGRQQIPLPECFEETRKAWMCRKITLVQAAAACSMSVSTFWKRAKNVKG